jgi:hypothetical protein
MPLREIVTIEPVDDTAIRGEALTWPDRARSVVVNDEASWTFASELLKGIAALKKRANQEYDDAIKRWHDGHVAELARKAQVTTPLTEADAILRAAMVAHVERQKKLAAAEQARLDAEARRQDEEDRLARAAAMETEGREYGDDALVEDAHALIAEPSTVVAAPVRTAIPKTAGVSTRETYGFRITDERKVPSIYKTIDHKKIRAVVNGLGKQANIPGVEVFVNTGITVKG